MALTNLQATYTDSEEEDEEHEEAERGVAEIVLREGSSSNSGSPLFGIESPKQLNISKDVSSKPASNTSGLVSYHLDDTIDDDAVDDYHSMDDSQSEKEEDTKGSGGEGGESKSPQIIVGEKHHEAMDVVEEEIITGTGKVRIPPEPPGKPPQDLLDRFNKLYEKKLQSRLDMNVYIQRNKQFRNPSIYEKLIKHCNIDELGTNYPPDIYNPHEWTESSFYDELAKVQKADMDRREKEKQERIKERTKVEFISGTAVKKPTGTSLPIPIVGVGSLSAAIAEAEKRKSKWDQRGSLPNVPHNYSAGTLPTSSLSSQAFPAQTNLTTSVTGTKSTVINAFGRFGNR